MDITFPGSVYEDALDPGTSGMAKEIGLPEPKVIRRGRGYTCVYEGITEDQAREAADYVYSRADTLLGQGIDDPYDAEEKRLRNTYRAAMKAADVIFEVVGKPTPPWVLVRQRALAEHPPTNLKWSDLREGMRLRCVSPPSAMANFKLGDEATVVAVYEGKHWKTATLHFDGREQRSGGFTSFNNFEIIKEEQS